jgi:hypothetical protein
MVSDIPPVGITQNERFLSCDTVLLGVRCIPQGTGKLLILRLNNALLYEAGVMVQSKKHNVILHRWQNSISGILTQCSNTSGASKRGSR